MKMVSLRKVAIAVPVVACAAMLSLDWSAQTGVTLSIDSAQARVGRPLTPMSGAGVARRHARRATYGTGAVAAGAVGAGLAVAGTAAAVAATAPYGGYYDGNPYYTGYYGGGPYHGQAYYGGGYAPAYANTMAYSRPAPQEYWKLNGMTCKPGTTAKLDDGRTYLCQ